jgi:predicted O-linked N-acetylglucosamine transferase (SPINDLY family)
VVDALRQGLPVVALEGAEPHSRTDSMILRRLGLPEELIARDEPGYAAAALRLIADDARRVEIGREALSRDIDAVMFGDAATPLGSEVVDAVWQAFRHHEVIMDDPRRAWPLKALRALA